MYKIFRNRLYLFLDRVSALPKGRIFVANILILILITYLDFLTGIEISVSIFYFIPISISAWLLGREYSLAFSFLGVLCWLTSDINESYIHNWLIVSWNALSRMGIFLIISFLIDNLKKGLLREKTAARIDSLTRIPNSRSFYEAGKSEIQRANRYKRDFSIAYLDVDNFKGVNDKSGHAAGDELLKKIGKIIVSNIRVTDVAARLGGDEFAAIFPETDAEKVKIILKHVKEKLDEMAKANNLSVSFSIGVVTCSGGDCTIQELIKEADAQMYKVKKHGKNSISSRQL